MILQSRFMSENKEAERNCFLLLSLVNIIMIPDEKYNIKLVQDTPVTLQ